MKKTLITLLALAGVASATPGDWTCDPTTIKDKEVVVSGSRVHTWNVSSAQTDGLDWSSTHAFSVALTLDVTSLESSKDYAVLTVQNTHNTTVFVGLASIAIKQGNVNFNLYNSSDPVGSVSLETMGAKSSLTLVLSRTSDAKIQLKAYADGNFDRAFGLGEGSNWNYSGPQVFYYGGLPDGTSYFNDNVSGLMPGNANAAQFTLTGAAYMTGGVATAEQLKTYYQLVPEPTTACLSLLALAGLAARRRR